MRTLDNIKLFIFTLFTTLYFITSCASYVFIYYEHWNNRNLILKSLFNIPLSELVF